jgi:hypothetical protein
VKARAGRLRALAGSLLCAALVVTAAHAQQQPPAGEPKVDVEELVNGLLGALLGGGNVDAATLQKEAEDAGGVPFKHEVPLAFLPRGELRAYLDELFAEEYPPALARTDERLLSSFDLLPPGTDLRALRARVLEDNIAGFYDERPGRRKLYAVSDDRSFTAMNQVVLVHELRHALQDQYADLDALLPDGASDYDDRRIAALALLEGDATLVMERFVRMRLGRLVPGAEEALGGEEAGDGLAALPEGLTDIPGAPPVVRDQLVQPYLAGLVFARAVHRRGGAEALKRAWSAPPASTEQVLHPERFFAGEAPRRVEPPGRTPRGAKLLSEGVLGELLARTLLGGAREAHGAAAGWGGDAWRLWDVSGKTSFAWRSEWDSRQDAEEFWGALFARFESRHGKPSAREGWQVFAGNGRSFALRRSGAEAVELVSSDEPKLLTELLTTSR